jgi:N-acetylneuraminic acid mutarotase
VVFGLDIGSKMVDIIPHVNLERKDLVRTSAATPSEIGQGATACVIANTLYVVGIGRHYNELWRCDVTTDWVQCQNMKSDRSWHCAAAVGCGLYVLGGWVKAHRSTLYSILKYNMKTNEWTVAGQLTQAVWGAACVAYKNSVYIFGGMDKDYKDVDHVQIYNAEEEKCDMMAQAIPQACSQMCAVLWKTSAIWFGCDACYIYDFEKQTWQEREKFRTNVDYFGLVVDNGRIYVAGGGKTQQESGKEMVYTCTDEIRRVSVLDIIDDKPAVWEHHAKLPLSALIYAYSPIPLLVPWDK